MPTKVHLVKAMVFPVVMWELNYKESWALKNWCFWTVVLDKTLESPLECKEIQPVNPKGNQSWIFIGRTDDEAETPILWPPDAKNWLIWKDPDAGKDWSREERGTTEDEMVGWHHWPSGHAAAAKSLQSCPTLCDPIDGSPPGSPIPGILQARTLEWVAISFSSALACRAPCERGARPPFMSGLNERTQVKYSAQGLVHNKP